MPKILETNCGKWHSVTIPGDFAKDENFSCLSTFEELVYDTNSTVDHKKKQKKQKVTKSKAEGKKTVANKRASERNKIKKKKASKSKTIEQSVEQENGAATNITDSESLVDKDPIDKSHEKKNVGNRKRKLTKKGHFLAEEPRKKCRLSQKKRSNASIDENCADPSTSKEDYVDLTLWQKFALPDQIMQGLKELKFSTPTEIQSLVLPSAVRDKLDILGAAETGSGKTLAFLIPLICRLLEIKPTEGQKKLKALILAPTRELVVQIKKYLDIFLKYTEFKAVCVVGGLSQQKQERIIKHCPEVVVATPGRFWALCEMFQSDSYLSDWSFLRVLVIDETDRMTEKGHFQELENILDRIRKEAPAERQTLVFSATLTFVHLPPHRLFVQQKSITTKDKLKQLISIIGLRPNRKVFDITKTTCTPEALVEAKMNCSNLLEKDTNVLYLLTRYKGRTLIFTNSIDASRRLHGILSKVRYDGTILMIHAKMIQKQRLVNLEKFSSKHNFFYFCCISGCVLETDNSVLIATDVAARGLDIPGIDHVIHYQVAKTAESYVHRSGRTARISQKGLAVMMVDPQDVKFYSRICRNLNREDQFPVFPVDNPELMEILKERVAAASQLDSLEHRMKKITSRENWFTKIAREAEGGEKAFSSSQLKELQREKAAVEAKLKALLAEKLPKFENWTKLKTRYITPEVVKSYEKEVTRSALVTLNEFETSTDVGKSKLLSSLSSRQILKIKKDASGKRKKRSKGKKF